LAISFTFSAALSVIAIIGFSSRQV